MRYLREVVPGSSPFNGLFVAQKLVGQVVDLLGVLASLLNFAERSSVFNFVWSPSVLANFVVTIIVVSDSLALDGLRRPDVVLAVDTEKIAERLGLLLVALDFAGCFHIGELICGEYVGKVVTGESLVHKNIDWTLCRDGAASERHKSGEFHPSYGFLWTLKVKRRTHATRCLNSSKGPRSCIAFRIQAGLDKKYQQERLSGL
jgi:hypothetical protein